MSANTRKTVPKIRAKELVLMRLAHGYSVLCLKCGAEFDLLFEPNVHREHPCRNARKQKSNRRLFQRLPFKSCPFCQSEYFEITGERPLPHHPCLDSGTNDLEELRNALYRSIKLQAHYAELLNMHDGGSRLIFEDAESWIKRLREVDPTKDSAKAGREKV